MNLLGHAHVCVVAGRDVPEVVLGALLPDLVGMAGVRLDPARLGPELAEGVRWHHAADGAFHAHGAFLAGASGLRLELEEAGVGRGAARAAGHVGWELLLDGTLLGSAAEAAVHRAREVAPVAVDVVRPVDRARFARFLARWAAAPGSPPYDDPAWVGTRLLAITAGRPRLAFADGDGPAVVAALSRHHAAVVASAPVLLADTSSRAREALSRRP